MKKLVWLLNLFDFILPPRRIKIVEGDTLPNKLPSRNLVLASEQGESWAVGFICPCGCGKKVELLLVEEASPNWKLTIDEKKRPSLYPSVWLKSGCCSHFWIKNGKVIWC